MHRLIRGATSGEMDVIAKLTVAEDRAAEPSIRAALGEGLELIRELIAERGRLHEFDGLAEDAGADPFPDDPPCSDE